MRNKLPRPDEILEELGDKTAAQIERLAPVAFDSAYREMTSYHRFLLGLGASRTPDGAAFNFGEVAGNAWHAPHKEWIRQYRRLFERAADRLVDDGHFIRALAYAPSRLLPRSGDPELSPNVVRAILDLGPLLVGRLEAWVTKRTTVETREGQTAEPRLALAGSDAKSYINVLPEIVGAWESLLHYPASMYGWRDEGDQSDAERWDAFRASWPFLWQHLTNTAYCLATAVWNEDEPGATLFREALVRWPDGMDHRLNIRSELRHRRLLFPDILSLTWAEASAKAAPLGHDYLPALRPDEIFSNVIHGAHNDTVLLTAALLLFWTIKQKQASEIGGRTARALLHRELIDAEHRPNVREWVGFRSLFLDFLRFEMAGEPHLDGSYANDLDGLVATLDNMTERRVVPGRVFTPSTLHGHGDLTLAKLSILLAHVPDNGDDGLVDRISALAREEEVLPGRDGALRNIQHELDQLRTTLEQPLPQLARSVSLLTPDCNAEQSRSRLGKIVAEAISAIELERKQRLAARPVDASKLEQIRAAVERALLTAQPEAPFFRGVEVGPADVGEGAEWRTMAISGIGKAQLTEPPMEPPGSAFVEMIVSSCRQMAGNYAWRAFCQRPRTPTALGVKIDERAFWREIEPLAAAVGAAPALVVSRNAEGRLLRRLLYNPRIERPELSIEQRASVGGHGYIATIEGIDVFVADFTPGEAWLFSATALRAVRYAQTGVASRHAELTFDLGEGMKGTLNVKVRQLLEWDDSSIFQLTISDSIDDETQQQ